jgi:broad specificity phosphatase PhoE
MIKIALLRHGHTSWNRAGQIQGRSDIPLDDDARRELRQYRLPAEWETAELWSSPLGRARETAEIVTGHSPKTAPGLTEMFWGDWEGKRGVDLLAQPDSGFRHIEDWGWPYCPPNGESPQQVSDRLMPWLHALTQDTVAVCHIGIMRVLMARATGWNFDGPAPFRIKRNRLFVLQLNDGILTADPEPVRLIHREDAA